MSGSLQVAIRAANAADLPAILEIYNYYVVHSTCTYQIEPDTEEKRARWFAKRGSAHPVTVAEADGTIVAWASLSPWNPREGYARTVEASIYVRHDLLRRGIGSALLSDLIERAQALGHHAILGGVCTTQTASIALQERFGFRQAGYLREAGFKFGRWLDVAIMELVL
ncbi:MAG: N-acetyltransferase [Gammaproteobacteria bacterium]|nr:N-acetyltransferase [Gammaproteobacteria bacterium]